MAGLVLHVDLDEFFSRLALKREPSLLGQPFGVYNPWRKTPLMASNYLAKKLGIESGMRIKEAKRILPDLKLVIEDPEMQTEASLDFFQALREENPEINIEAYGIDEAFLDYGHFDFIQAFLKFRELMRILNQRLGKKWGLTVSGCLAPNKWLAKMGTNFIKPNGLLVIPNPSFVKIFYPLGVRKFHGIREKIGQKLNETGIETIGDLSQTPLANLTASFGLALGQKLYFFSRGLGQTPIIPWQPAKSIGNTIRCDSYFFEHLKERLRLLSLKVEERMKEEGYWARKVIVSLRFREDGLRWISKGKSLPKPNYFNEKERIYQIALDLLSEIYQKREFNRIGLKVTNLVRGWSQLKFF